MSSNNNLLIIDNYDSFTYNLVAYCKELGANCIVVENDKINLEDVISINSDKILISPGPGNTKDSGISNDIIKHFYNKKPILGVCLGHQCIAEFFGGRVISAKRLMHGKTSKIIHDNSTLFKHIHNNFIATRYHSLIVDDTSVPDSLKITAFSEYINNDIVHKEIMAIEHKDYPVYGVQFHPEAVLTQYGHDLLRNFLSI